MLIWMSSTAPSRGELGARDGRGRFGGCLRSRSTRGTSALPAGHEFSLWPGATSRRQVAGCRAAHQEPPPPPPAPPPTPPPPIPPPPLPEDGGLTLVSWQLDTNTGPQAA